jgi:membrane-bound lytic murein transglycosylase C
MKLGVYTLAILLMLHPFCLFSQQFDDPFEDDAEQLDAMLDTQFQETDEALERKFLQVQQAIDAAYKGLTKKIEVNWHSDIKLPGKTSWLTYDETFTSRAQFDFERGVYQIETLVDKDVASSLLKLKAIAVGLATSNQKELKSKDVFNKAINQQLDKSFDLNVLLAQEQKSNPIQHINVRQILPFNTESLITQVRLDNIVMHHPELTNKRSIDLKNRTSEKAPIITIPVSEDLPTLITKEIVEIVQDTDAPKIISTPTTNETVEIVQDTVAPEVIATPTTNDTAEIVQQTVAPKAISTLKINETVDIVQQTAPPKVLPTLTINETEGITKLVLTIPFVNNFQKVLMENRLDTVKTVAKRFNIDVSLILAVIETESSFNPMATSPIPAFGLMQLVPRTAGIDSYQFVHGYQKIVSPEYLYNQENNLTLGTAYLHLLSNRYLRKVNDGQSKLYCVLASYNTGIGNLAKTLINKNNLGKAVMKINSMTSEQVYEHLMKHLPAEETKNYLIKILRRKQKYLHLDQI